MRLSELAYPEVEALVAKGAVALWPIGSTEAHGPHLPLSTDVIISEETCLRSAERIRSELHLEAIVLPPLSFTVTEYASSFAGTLSIPKETAVAYLRDVVIATARQGFRGVCLVNAHLEPAHRYALREARDEAAARVTSPIVIADPCDRRWVPTLTDELKSGSCHAGQYETSLVLAAKGRVKGHDLPEVDIDLVASMKAGMKTFTEMGATLGYFGRPAAATLAEGQDTYERLVEMVVVTLREALEGQQ